MAEFSTGQPHSDTDCQHFMTTHAPTIAFAGIDCLDIDVQVQIAAGLPAFTNVGPITPEWGYSDD
jgi:hypothetical protein